MRDVVIHIPSDELYREFQKYLFSKGFSWAWNQRTKVSLKRDYGEKHCVRIIWAEKRFVYGSMPHYLEEGREIVEIGEFINTILPEREKKCGKQ